MCPILPFLHVYGPNTSRLKTIFNKKIGGVIGKTIFGILVPITFTCFLYCKGMFRRGMLALFVSRLYQILGGILVTCCYEMQ